jgi:hypothetical protein
VIAALGVDTAYALIREVRAVERRGGMPIRDGSRQRTLGGIFFALADERLVQQRARAVRRQADLCARQELLRRFLRLLAFGLVGGPAPGGCRHAR